MFYYYYYYFIIKKKNNNNNKNNNDNNNKNNNNYNNQSGRRSVVIFISILLKLPIWTKIIIIIIIKIINNNNNINNKLWPLHSSPTDQRRDLEGFEECRCSLNKRTSRLTQRWWKASGWFNPGAMAKWSQSHVGRHCCGHSGQLLHANHVSDILWSCGGSSNVEES